MAYPVMSGMRADVQGVLVDPNFSAWRHITPLTGAWLASAQSVTSIGTILDARVNGGPLGAGLLYWTVSGNTISGAFIGSPDSTSWFTISSFANTAGTTATAQWSGYFPYISVSATYVSAGVRTGQFSVNLYLK